jgi:hypothetical protein
VVENQPDGQTLLLAPSPRIDHTEGADRISEKVRAINLDDRLGFYREMALETEYLGLLKRYRPGTYALVQRNIALAQATAGRRTEAWKAYREAKSQLPAAHRLAVIFASLAGGGARWQS